MELAKIGDIDAVHVESIPYSDFESMNRAVFKFENNYGASVINRGRHGGVELAVLVFDANGLYNITYDTPVTGDVIPWIEDEAELFGILNKIRSLPNAPSYAIQGRYSVKRLA